MSAPNYPYKDFTEAIAKLDEETDREARLRFEQKKGSFLIGALGAGVGAFFKTYFFQRHCRYGVPGLFYAVHEGMRPFLCHAKLWELRKKTAHP